MTAYTAVVEFGNWPRTRRSNSLCRMRPFRLVTFEITNGADLVHQGDVLPAEAYQRLQANPNAVLIDVRTQPEWVFVGVPAVERLIRLSWQVFPAMQVNAQFVAEIDQMGLPKDTEILCICRSGARSASAASALTQAGYGNAWNVAQGFEGDKDSTGHRGSIGGWKAAGLPWVQS